ncbi:MAG: RagB/SusD family nutrient uptake outer membrane protein [Bacteroides sp.]|nr:RagB/SusD family nutrient uptake outer membrane protein [Bacteroides sp.]
MKSYKLLFIAGALLLSSCNGFLDLVPGDKESGGSFYRTEEQLRQAVVVAYVPLRDFADNDFFTGEGRSDNAHYDYTPANRGSAYVFRENIYDFTDGPENTYVNAVYYHCYKGISRANIAIDYIEKSSIDDEVKKDLIGQSKFLRAFFYYKLVRYFGGVPLYLHEVATAEGAFLPRSSEDEVYAQIITDAQAAIDNLKAPEKFPQTGEATKGAATILLADVYVTRKNYKEAEALLKTLPAMGYGLLGNYSYVFSTANKNSKEFLFSIQYMQGLQGGQQSNFIYKFLPRSTNTRVVTDVATNNSSLGGWNVPTDDLINAYEPGDLRKSASIGIAEGTYNSSYMFTYTANTDIEEYVPKEGIAGVPYIKKYLNPHTDPNNTDGNWPVYRYAEALLLLAEAVNEQGRGQEALPYLNEVRQRAGLKGVTVTNQAQLREIILKERRVELAFENKRWHDLVRSGKAVEVMTAYGKALKEQYTYLVDDSYKVSEYRLLFPLPFDEVEMNKEIKQNEGY